MENNNKDKPVRVRITGCFDQVSAWYRDLIGREYEVTDYLELWYKVRDYQLIYKSDCEVISPEPSKYTESQWQDMMTTAAGTDNPNFPPPVNEGEKAEDLKTFIDEICEEALELVVKLLPAEDYGENEDAERLVEIIDELKYFKNIPAKTEAWATDEDIREAMLYAFGYASSSPLIRLDVVINNYLQSLKNKKA